ncbi:hypothetical protein K491DRAFT_758716 [Lophiostoma macrostomum CBS 122681]|uniref:Uncharacterized protein n=1 Tax=Lophiostoma macrostomum CBS 122681 TaxID=1314788 RepID=A0A6A6T696_9PLEO|nr:hypothetical protein K491DRAFT_758716 [Lophiostoma macrostomum CBS 122681]
MPAGTGVNRDNAGSGELRGHVPAPGHSTRPTRKTELWWMYRHEEECDIDVLIFERAISLRSGAARVRAGPPLQVSWAAVGIIRGVGRSNGGIRTSEEPTWAGLPHDGALSGCCRRQRWLGRGSSASNAGRGRGDERGRCGVESSDGRATESSSSRQPGTAEGRYMYSSRRRHCALLLRCALAALLCSGGRYGGKKTLHHKDSAQPWLSRVAATAPRGRAGDCECGDDTRRPSREAARRGQGWANVTHGRGRAPAGSPSLGAPCQQPTRMLPWGLGATLSSTRNGLGDMQTCSRDGAECWVAGEHQMHVHHTPESRPQQHLQAAPRALCSCRTGPRCARGSAAGLPEPWVSRHFSQLPPAKSNCCGAIQRIICRPLSHDRDASRPQGLISAAGQWTRPRPSAEETVAHAADSRASMDDRHKLRAAGHDFGAPSRITMKHPSDIRLPGACSAAGNARAC